MPDLDEDELKATRKFNGADRTVEDLWKELELKDKMIDLMAENLTTPLCDKEWVKNYYAIEVKKLI